MKGRFSTVDIAVVVQELKRFLGMRVVNVYDIDNKTYLIRVGKPDEKTVILLESGTRLHSTEFDWPKNPAPSGFSMKLRKHLKGRRFESIHQLGIDRIVDLQFGSSEAAYHIILELYDRGNMVLTDHEYTILTLLRPRTDASQDVRFAVREKYPIENGKVHQIPNPERIKELMESGKDGDVLKKILVPNLDYGPAIIDHVLLGAGFTENVKFGKGFDLATDFDRLMQAINEAETLLQKCTTESCKGYIVQKVDKKPNPKEGEEESILLYDEFHPFKYRQHEKKHIAEFDKFDRAVDEFFSKLESQKLDMKVIQQEKSALKKLDNVKKDHEKRIEGLQKEQEADILRGQLIEMNLDLVDQAILIVRSAVANQIDWTEIWNLVKEAQVNGDLVASSIKALKLDTNMITLLLQDPYAANYVEDDEDAVSPLKPMRVDIDLGVSAYGNSRRFFDKKKQAAKKEQKTMEASQKAFKSAEKKTKQTLKEVATAASINKTRKTYWFEKFLWFISSENYLVIGGRDQQQNELIVKRYMKAGDLYVHADLHGASSCIIKNLGGDPVPPKTLNEAGTMAICNSAAWDSKVVTSAWWVHHDQVSKTAPSGEYLTTGSFMIRGKKNYLPPSYLIYGFGFLFKLEDGSVERHKGERKVKLTEDDAMSVADSVMSSLPESDDIDIEISDDEESKCEDDGDEEKQNDGTDNMKPDDEDFVEPDQVVSSKTVDTDEISVQAKKAVKEKPAGDGDSAQFAFPDTNISLMHVKGDKYELHRELCTASAASENSDTFYLGDNEPVTLGAKTSSTSGRMSAKQRREMKKQRKGQGLSKEDENDDEEESVSWLAPKKSEPKVNEVSKKNGETERDEEEDESNDDAQQQSQAQSGPLKRGQRNKKKKMKEKYADQDEEERQLRLEILASARVQKEEKKKKGVKKGKESHPVTSGKKPQGSNPQADSSKGQTQRNKGAEKADPENLQTISEALSKTNLEDDSNKDPNTRQSSAKGTDREKEKDIDSDGEKDEETGVDGDEVILNSLTGIPISEDELLYAIPVCAPYNALLNYKFKVKLMPGSTKKGKAVKTALAMFIHEKAASNREKDLLKIQKDVDLSRNVPGKVKVAAPNLHRKR